MRDPGGAVRPRLIGVGVGPGDAGLLTERGRQAIGTAPLIFTPVRRVGEASLAAGIVRAHLDDTRQHVVSVPFPRPDHGETWESTASEILPRLRSVGRAVFLTEGDPGLFSTFADVARALRTAGPDVEIEIVPGVSSISAAAARAGIDLANEGESIAILPAGPRLADISSALATFDTVVLMKVGPVLPRVIEQIDGAGRLEEAVYVRRCGMEGEAIVTDLGRADVADMRDYFSIVLVRRGGSAW
ncbi:MAG: precorrin-2 C(20)-methyltransferase [Chloroflexota bacterium]